MRNALAAVVLCLVLAPAACAEECEPTPNPGQQPTQPGPTPTPEGQQQPDPGATGERSPIDLPFHVLPPEVYETGHDLPLAPYSAGGDHSALQNLQGDTHTQYLDRSGARAMTGNLGLGLGNALNAVAHRQTSGLWFQWPRPGPKFDPESVDPEGGASQPSTLPSDNYCSESRGLDSSSPAGQVIQPYVTGSTIVEVAWATRESSWTSSSTLTFTQPLLRCFGFNFGSSVIHIADHTVIGGSTGTTITTDPDTNLLQMDVKNLEALTGMGIISSDPKFATTSRGGYHLANTSPSIDSCTAGSGTDMDGVTRPLFTWDMGASGSPEAYGSVFDRAVTSATTQGVLVIAPAGNDGHLGRVPEPTSAPHTTLAASEFSYEASQVRKDWSLTAPSGTKIIHVWFRDRFGNDTREPLFTTASQVPSDRQPWSLLESQGVGLRHKYTYRVFMSGTPSPLHVIEQVQGSQQETQDRDEEYARAVKEAQEKAELANGIGDELGGTFAAGPDQPAGPGTPRVRILRNPKSDGK